MSSTLAVAARLGQKPIHWITIFGKISMNFGIGLVFTKLQCHILELCMIYERRYFALMLLFILFRRHSKLNK